LSILIREAAYHVWAKECGAAVLHGNEVSAVAFAGARVSRSLLVIGVSAVMVALLTLFFHGTPLAGRCAPAP